MCFDQKMSGNSNQKLKLNGSTDPSHSGILNERIILLIFEYLKWDIHALCRAACVNRRLRALAKRLLWRELCLRRAPRMTSELTDPRAGSSSKVSGGWHALAKLLFFCGGSAGPGHFARSSRFSKTSGKSFLAKRCRGDVLFVSDPCEHPHPVREAEHDDVAGVYRGVFREFCKSRTRAYLVSRRVEFELESRCPYCGARVWSMAAACMIRKESVARRLGASGEDAVEYFVCLNGHLSGTCWLVPLSSDEANSNSDDSDDSDSDSDSDDVGPSGVSDGRNGVNGFSMN